MTAVLEDDRTSTAAHGAARVAPRRRHLIISTPLFVILITLLAGALRFIHLDRPTLWYDEAATYSRICGTYQQMIDVLRSDGFGPLHYEIEWLLARHFKMTPTMLRLVPAIAGTLMIPAIYLLAFELLGHRAARWSSLFAACSAFLLAYSRDAKMYMQLWFCLTLHVGCLLWWMRTGKLTAWLAFVAAGCAAVAFHVTGLTVLALDLVIGLTGPKVTGRRSATLIIGLLLVASGPIGYALKFNQMNQEVDQHGWGATGISWVVGRTRDHDGAALAADSASSYLFAFSWCDEETARVEVPKWIMASAAGLLSLFTAAIAAGAVSWRQSNEMPPRVPAVQRWRAAFWLALAIFVPVYAMYRVSVPYAASPMDWWQDLHDFLLANRHWIGIAAALVLSTAAVWFRPARFPLALLGAVLVVWAIGVLVARSVLEDLYSTVPPPRWLVANSLLLPIALAMLAPIGFVNSSWRVTRRPAIALGFVVTLAAVFGLCQAVDTAAFGRELHPLWMPRYLGFICPAVIIATASLLSRLPFAPLRWTVFGLLLAVNLTQGAAHVWAASEPPVDHAAVDTAASLAAHTDTLTFTPDPIHTRGPNGTGSLINFCGQYYLVLDTGKTLTPEEFRYEEIQQFFPLRMDSDPEAVMADVRRHPEAKRIVIWDRIDVGNPVPDEDLLGRLGENWKRVEQTLRPVRVFWDWGTLYVCRRRVYSRS